MNATIKQREEKRSQCSRSKPTVDPRQLLGGRQARQPRNVRKSCLWYPYDDPLIYMMVTVLMILLVVAMMINWSIVTRGSYWGPNWSQSISCRGRQRRQRDWFQFISMMMMLIADADGGLYASPFNWFSFFKIRVTFKLVKTLLNITKCLTMEESNHSTNHGERILAMSFFPPSIAPVNGSA